MLCNFYLPTSKEQYLFAEITYLILFLNSRPELLHQPQAVPERRLVHQHWPGQLHLYLPARVHRQKLRDRDQRVRQQPLQERRQLQSEWAPQI